MTGSEVTSYWPTETCSPPRAMHPHNQAYGQVISLPSFEGRFNPAVYIHWEFEVEQILRVIIFLNFREYELPLAHLLVLLPFGGVCILSNILIINLQFVNI